MDRVKRTKRCRVDLDGALENGLGQRNQGNVSEHRGGPLECFPVRLPGGSQHLDAEQAARSSLGPLSKPLDQGRRLVLLFDQLDEGRGVEVSDHRRPTSSSLCSATISLNGRSPGSGASTATGSPRRVTSSVSPRSTRRKCTLRFCRNSLTVTLASMCVTVAHGLALVLGL